MNSLSSYYPIFCSDFTRKNESLPATAANQRNYDSSACNTNGKNLIILETLLQYHAVNVFKARVSEPGVLSWVNVATSHNQVLLEL